MASSLNRVALGSGTEFDWIRRFLERAAARTVDSDAPDAGGRSGWRVHTGPGDDCALLQADGARGLLAVSTDLSVEGVHFRREWLSWSEVGYRAAAAALSDLAAVGATPLAMLVSLALPSRDGEDSAVALMDGVARAASESGALLAGGDLTVSPAGATVDIVVLGTAARAVLRSGAGAGDELWVTGKLGAAAAAVAAWDSGGEPTEAAREAFARPRARLREAAWLVERRVPRAMIDLSDGLAGDLRHLAAANGLAVVLEAAEVPVHPTAHELAGTDPLHLALAGGEDYELCFAASPGSLSGLVDEFHDVFGISLTRIGRFEAGHGVFLVGSNGERRPLELAGYLHFKGTASS
jgi:thiamine-monophosphate kinase